VKQNSCDCKDCPCKDRESNILDGDSTGKSMFNNIIKIKHLIKRSSAMKSCRSGVVFFKIMENFYFYFKYLLMLNNNALLNNRTTVG